MVHAPSIDRQEERLMGLATAARILVFLLFGVGSLVFCSCVYLLTLAIASFLRRPRRQASAPTKRIVVLVPAHNEEELLGRCLDSISNQSYPRALHYTVVIVDNCTDSTAEVATAHGAEVMVRSEPAAPGKGRALRWALDQLLSQSNPPDAVVMIDADSVAEHDLLLHVEAELTAGAEVVQSDYRILDGDASTRSRFVAAGFLLFHRTRLAGRAALGLPANLVGNGMAFAREVLERVPWSAFTAVEDLEYSLILRMSGVRP